VSMKFKIATNIGGVPIPAALNPPITVRVEAMPERNRKTGDAAAILDSLSDKRDPGNIYVCLCMGNLTK
jgi:hypothetical protein